MQRALNFHNNEAKKQKRKSDVMTTGFSKEESSFNNFCLLKSKKNTDFSAVKAIFYDHNISSSARIPVVKKVPIVNTEQKIITSFFKTTKKLSENGKKEEK